MAAPNERGKISIIDNLFLQIFDNKKRIIEQVHNQAVLFDRHLASMCLLEGIAPPSWLLSPSFSSLSSDLNELKKEELISGLLLPHSQSAKPYFNGDYSLYEEPIVTSCNKGLPNASFMEVYASNNGTEAADRLSVLPPFPTDDTQRIFNDVPDLDTSVTSPPDCADARISDNDHDHAQSLVKIQRSKSRQRALEDRNSAKANKMFSNGLIPPMNHVIELPEPSDPHAFADSSCVAEANVVNCRGKEKNNIVFSDRITRSRSSISQASTWKEALVAGNSSCIAEVDDGHKEFHDKSVKHSSSVSELLELFGPLPTIPNESYGSRKAKARDKGIKEKDSNIYVWRITRSKSSVRKINCINECLGLDNSYGNGQKEDISKQKQQSDHAQARFVGPKQLDFDDAEESSWHETLDLALENKKVGTSRKQLSKMQSMDLLDKVTSVDYREKPIQSLEMPLLEEQELLSKKREI